MTKDEEYESAERDTRYEEQIEEWTGWLRDAGKGG
jgi:hypothetical protein